MCSENMACSRNSNDGLCLGLESNRAGDDDQQGRPGTGRRPDHMNPESLKKCGLYSEDNGKSLTITRHV